MSHVTSNSVKIVIKAKINVQFVLTDSIWIKAYAMVARYMTANLARIAHAIFARMVSD